MPRPPLPITPSVSAPSPGATSLAGLPSFPKPRGPAPVLPASEPALKGLSLRNATDADLPFLVQLYLRLRSHEFLAAPWTPAERAAVMTDQFRLQHAQLLKDFPKADYWIVDRTEGGATKPVGRYYIDRTRPVWRGVDIGFFPEDRRRGYGAALLRWTKDEIRAMGAEGMDFHVAVDNPRAHALYVRLGYRDIDPPRLNHQRMIWLVADDRSGGG